MKIVVSWFKFQLDLIPEVQSIISQRWLIMAMRKLAHIHYLKWWLPWLLTHIYASLGRDVYHWANLKTILYWGHKNTMAFETTRDWKFTQQLVRVYNKEHIKDVHCWIFVKENATMTGDQWIPSYPDSKVHGANMGPTWVLSAPDGPHVGPMHLAIRVI